MTAAAVDWWSPMGIAGSVVLTDQVEPFDFYRRRAEQERPQHRCVLEVPGLRVRLDWLGRRLLATPVPQGAVVDPGRPPTGEPVTTGVHNGVAPIAGQGVFTYRLMAADLDGAPVTMSREPHGRDRWELLAEHPTGHLWHWYPVGRVRADHLVLVRDGSDGPVVTNWLHPVPGTRRTPGSPTTTLEWTPLATRAELLLTTMWTLERLWDGILPKAHQTLLFRFLH